MLKSPRNKTIVLSKDEIESYTSELIKVAGKVGISDVVNQTINQDIFEVLPLLPSSFVDLMFVDPPYNMNKVFGSQSFKKMGNQTYEEWLESWIVETKRVLKPTASLYVCGDWVSSSPLFNVLSKHFNVLNRITWEREKGRGSKTNWKNSSEDIWFASRSKDYYFDVDAVKIKKQNRTGYRDKEGKPKDWFVSEEGSFRLTHPSNTWTDLTVPFWSMSENTEHPTQKPEKLVAKAILASSKEGDVVFDPFLGSGTTSVVAKKLGRRYVGIEVDTYYACVAQKRLDAASSCKRIQGYEDHVFWERNSNPKKNKG